MNSKNKIKAKEWFEKAEHDIKAVELILQNSGPADVAGVLLQQGVEKYLKGYLISQGWTLNKIHNLKNLLDEAVKYNQGFVDFYDLATILTAYYFEEKYPLEGTESTLEDVKDKFEQTKGIIRLIRRET